MDAGEGRIPIGSEGDIIAVRKMVRDVATGLGFGVTDVTRIVTAASELARNVFRYAGTGSMYWHKLSEGPGLGIGIELRFEDRGPGIANVSRALEMGYTTSGGLGLGLPGAKRLMDEMAIESALGQGTTITTKKWRK